MTLILYCSHMKLFVAPPNQCFNSKLYYQTQTNLRFLHQGNHRTKNPVVKKETDIHQEIRSEGIIQAFNFRSALSLRTVVDDSYSSLTLLEYFSLANASGQVSSNKHCDVKEVGDFRFDI